MAGIFGAKRVNSTTAPAIQLRVQSAIEGKAIPIGWGANRLAGNLIWYGDFKSVASSSGGAGKGGGGGKGSGQYDYSASVIIAMCEGPVHSWGYLYNNSSNTIAYSSLNLTTFNGDYAQSGWGYLSGDPAQRNYRGLAYMAAGPMPLGSSPDLPNITPEIIFGTYTDGISGLPDANAATVVSGYLTSPDYGSGFPSAHLGDLTVYRQYTLSVGLVVSPVITDQAEARQFLVDLLEATNAAAVWSSGKLQIVPYGDIPTSGNGASYTPPSAALYSLSDIDFKPLQGSNSNSKGSSSATGPIALNLTDDPATRPNAWSVEYLERGNAYNPTVITVQDEAAVATYGLRTAQKKSYHFFCASFAASMSAELTKGRAQVAATYAFTVGQEYILLDPMDIIEINDPALGLSQKWVRITEITENADNTLTIQAEEYLLGTGGAPSHSMQVGSGFSPAVNAAPTSPFSSVVWEPSYTLAGGLEIWIAASGQADFGGAEVYVSTDNSSYSLIGEITGPSRIGDLTASLASVTPAGSGLTIDSTHTLSVDMSPSGQQLIAGTTADAQAANTLCYVSSGGSGPGEYLAYSGATLGSGETYALTYLNRGLYETTPVSHASGASFVRLIPGTFLRWALTPDRIGTTFYFKILPFNPYGGGQLSLADVTAISYTVVGSAFANVSSGTLAVRNNLGTGWLPIGTYNPTTTTFTAPVANAVPAVGVTGTLVASQIGSVNASALTGSITASQIGSVNASSLTGSITASQISGVNASVITGGISSSQITSLTAGQITGTLSASQIGGVNVGSLVGSISAGQITSLTAGQITGTLTAGQIGSVGAASITGTLSSGQIGSVAAASVTGTLTASQIGAVNAASVTGTLSAGQIGSIGAAQITGTLTSGQIGSIGALQIIGTLSDSQLASISGGKVTGTISSAVIPAGNLTGTLTYTQIASVAASTITGQVGAAQISAVNASSITGQVAASQINTVTAGQITGSISSSQIGSVNASSIVGSISSSQISTLNVSQLVGSISSSQIASVAASLVTGTLTASQIGSVAASTITGTLSAGQIGSVNASSISGTITAGQIGTVNSSSITSVAAGVITGTLAAGQIGSVNVGVLNGTLVTSQIGTLQVTTPLLASGAVTYQGYAYNEYVWTPPTYYQTDSGCEVTVTLTDSTEFVIITVYEMHEYNNVAAGVITGGNVGGSGYSGGELGGPG